MRERGWDGDDELADQLGALLRASPTPLLRPLQVDREELVGALEDDPMFGGGRVDLLTGQVWPQPAIGYARETGEEDEDESDDPDRRLWVHCEGARAGYLDMVQLVGPLRRATALTGLRAKVVGCPLMAGLDAKTTGSLVADQDGLYIGRSAVAPNMVRLPVTASWGKAEVRRPLN